MSLTVYTIDDRPVPVPDGDATDVDDQGNLTVFREGRGVAVFAEGQWSYVVVEEVKTR